MHRTTRSRCTTRHRTRTTHMRALHTTCIKRHAHHAFAREDGIGCTLYNLLFIDLTYLSRITTLSQTMCHAPPHLMWTIVRFVWDHTQQVAKSVVRAHPHVALRAHVTTLSQTTFTNHHDVSRNTIFNVDKYENSSWNSVAHTRTRTRAHVATNQTLSQTTTTTISNVDEYENPSGKRSQCVARARSHAHARAHARTRTRARAHA